MAERDLKPCPFCGGEAKLCKANGEVWIECNSCRCGTAFINGATPIEKKMELAVFDWNRRVKDA